MGRLDPIVGRGLCTIGMTDIDGRQRGDELHQTAMRVIDEWCNEFKHETRTFNRSLKAGFKFWGVIVCKGTLAHRKRMFAGTAYISLSKDTRWNVAHVDLVIVFGVYHSRVS
jgi:hypothetical protein